MRWLNLDWKRHRELTHFQEHILSLEQTAEQLAVRIHQIKKVICPIEYLEKGCRISPYFRYALSDLGIEPCLKLGFKRSTHHWLLTVMDEQYPNKVLQLHIASSDSAQSCPTRQVVYIQEGILTRRYIKSKFLNKLSDQD